VRTIFASTEGIHISLSPEPLFELGGFVFSNAMLYGIITGLFMFWVLKKVADNVSIEPTKKAFVSIFESIIEYVIKILEGAFGSREKGVKFAPIFAFFFLFIIFSNIGGLLPFVSPAFTLGESNLFRPLTADLNGTIAMSVIAIIVVQVLSIKEQGVKGHLKHYFSDKPLNPINFFIGVLEVFGEFVRVLSLSLRLFLNTAVGEILIEVFTSMILVYGRTPIAVIPILLFELLVAYIQAYVFTILTANYLGIAISHADHHDEEAHEEDEEAAPASRPRAMGTPETAPTAGPHSIDHHSPATLKNRLVGNDG
jgi:F-type H+-transporting ATPase subunit a